MKKLGPESLGDLTKGTQLVTGGSEIECRPSDRRIILLSTTTPLSSRNHYV